MPNLRHEQVKMSVLKDELRKKEKAKAESHSQETNVAKEEKDATQHKRTKQYESRMYL